MTYRTIVVMGVAIGLAAVVPRPGLAQGCPPPGEPSDLLFRSDGQTILWNDAPSNGGATLLYDVLRSDMPSTFSDGTATVCVESNDGLDTMAVDGAIPAPGGLFGYLARAETECGLGSLGFGAASTVRPQGIQCGACLSDATCDDGLVCNGVERCPGEDARCEPGVPLSCGVFSCSEDAGGCLSTCGDDVDCANGFGCLQGACLEAIDVTSTADEPDADPGDGECRTAAGGCTLRAAIQTVNALGTFRLIRLPAGIFLLTRQGAGEDGGDTGDLDLLQDMAIRGESAARTWIDAQENDRVFQIGPAANVTLARLKAQRGRTDSPGGGAPELGGGILNEGALQLLEVEVNANRTEGDGGGIANLGTLGLLRSTVSFNRAAMKGGGIFNMGSASIEVSTISSNDAADLGGGIYQDRLGGDLTLRNDTIFGNAAADGGGLYWPGNTSLVMTNTALVDSLSGNDCSAALPSNGHNAASDFSCDLTGPGDLQGIEALLAALTVIGDSGIRTHSPMPDSPLGGGGDLATQPPYDQNGLPTYGNPPFIGSVPPYPPTLPMGKGRLYRAGPEGIDIYETLLYAKVGSFPTSTAGNSMEVHPDGTFLYSLYFGDLAIYQIVGDTLLPLGMPLELQANSFDVHPSGAWLFACGSGPSGGIVYAIDTSTGNVVNSATASGTSSLKDCAVNSYGNATLLATTGTNSVVAFSADSALTPKATPAWPAPWRSHQVVRGTGGTFYSAEYTSPSPYQNRLSYVSSWGATPIPILALPQTISAPVHDLVMHPDGTRVYVSLDGPDGWELMEVLTTNPGSVIKEWGGAATQIAVDALGYRVYAVGPTVFAIDTATKQIVHQIPTNPIRNGIAVKP